MWVKYLSPLLSVLVLVVGMGVNYGVTQSSIDSNRRDILSTRSELIEVKKEATRNRDEIVALKIQAAEDREWKANVTKTLEEIQKKLDRLVELKRRGKGG